MKTTRVFIVVLAALLFSSLGYAPTKTAFLTVQLCLRDRAGASQLVSDLQDLAQSKHMEFFDSGAAMAKDLVTSGYRGRERSDGSPGD